MRRERWNHSVAPRPAVGVGITPITGLRFGVSATRGPYLNRKLSNVQLDNQDWRSFPQSVLGLELNASRGYVEVIGEAAMSRYEVPAKGSIDGLMYYVEPRVTITPRLYVAARAERNDYPYIAPVSATTSQWIAASSVFADVEVGGGYRVSPSTLLKLSLRLDRWSPNPNPNAPHDDGYALAMQLSQRFDLAELFVARP